MNAEKDSIFTYPSFCLVKFLRVKQLEKKNEICPSFPDKVEIHKASRKDLAIQACNFPLKKKWCLQIRSMIVFGSRKRW